MRAAAHQLVFRAAIVRLRGLLPCARHARAIKREAPAHVVNSWLVVHLSLPIGAVLMLGVAAVLPELALSATLGRVLVLALIVSAYGFAVSTPLAAVTAQRGLGSDGVGAGKVAYPGNRVGAGASLAAATALVVAAWLALWSPPEVSRRSCAPI